MKRLPPAARQLLKQVEREYPDAAYDVVGEEDGLGVYRSIQFDPATSQTLEPVLRAMRDPRITALEWRGDAADELIVTFVADARADFAMPFPVRETRRAYLNAQPKPVVTSPPGNAARDVWVAWVVDNERATEEDLVGMGRDQIRNLYG